jgi:hypothetical protein
MVRIAESGFDVDTVVTETLLLQVQELIAEQGESMLSEFITHIASDTGLNQKKAKSALGIVLNAAERQGAPSGGQPGTAPPLLFSEFYPLGDQHGLLLASSAARRCRRGGPSPARTIRRTQIPQPLRRLGLDAQGLGQHFSVEDPGLHPMIP